MKYEFERKVNQVIWASVFNDPTLDYFRENGYENSTFEVKPYNWNDEEENDYHFWHKPSGFKLQWYKYPLRSPMVNMEITHEQFLDVLRDCHNSVHKNCWYSVDEWWNDESEVAE